MTEGPIPSAERILLSLREAGIPQSVIAKKLALPSSAVSNLFNGKRNLQLHEANVLLTLLPPTRRELEVPVIGMSGAGRWLEAIEEARQTVIFPAQMDAQGRFAVEVVGDSMNAAGLPDGSFALVDPEQTSLYVGKIYLLRNGDGEATIKRYRSDPARFEPVSSNPEHQPFELGSCDFKIVGRVTASVQSL